MQIQVQCPACKASFAVPAELAGRDGECSRCLKIFKLMPLSGDTPSASFSASDSGATLEMPAYEDGATPDTDEFDIPALPPDQHSPEPTSHEPDASDPVGLTQPSAPADESQIELDHVVDQPSSKQQPSSSGSRIRAVPAAAGEPVLAEPVLPEIEDDGSLFGDEIPELESVPEPISRYAAEDEVSSDTGSYSPSDTSSERTPSKKSSGRRPRRRKKPATKGKRGTRSSDIPRAGNPREHDSDVNDSDVDGVDLIEAVPHEDQTSESPIVLKRSGTFSSSAGSAVEDSNDSGDSATTGPLLKRQPRAVRRSTPASGAVKPTAGKKPHRRSPGSPQTLAIAAGGAILLLIAGAYSWWSSGPSIVSPTLQNQSSAASSVRSSGSASQPGLNSATPLPVETGSMAPRTTASPPRRTGTDSTAGGNRPALLETAPRGSGNQETGAAGSGTRPAGAVSDASRTDNVSLFSIDRVPIPEFPRLGTPRASTIAGVLYHEISLGNPRSRSPSNNTPSDNQPVAGSQMDMILYLPSGSHQTGSLPCVLIAAAGTTLLEGNGCFDESYQSETIPYVQQGFAVLGYSLDGPLSSEQPTNREVVTAYRQFRAAHAGLVNARNALEFLLQQVPVVDPNQIYSAGHSSAGTLSLLFAQHESRLAGAIAYAPCVDVEKRLADYVSDPRVQLLLPEIGAFVRQESPLRHLESLTCPVFLFHAEGDLNSPCAESQRLAAMLSAQGTSCQLETIPDGDHYDSMLEEGIPRGIAWLKQQLPAQ